jgi:hypothetical protein
MKSIKNVLISLFVLLAVFKIHCTLVGRYSVRMQIITNFEHTTIQPFKLVSPKYNSTQKLIFFILTRFRIIRYVPMLHRLFKPSHS